MKLHEQIRIAREKRGLTTSELARQLGVSKTAVDYWEAGKHAPRLPMLETLEAILQTKFDATGTPTSDKSTGPFPGLSADDLQLALAISRLPADVRQALETLIHAYDPLVRPGGRSIAGRTTAYTTEPGPTLTLRTKTAPRRTKAA